MPGIGTCGKAKAIPPATATEHGGALADHFVPFQPARWEAAWERTRVRAAGRAGSRREELKGGRERVRNQAPQRNSWKGIKGAGSIRPSFFNFQTRLR